MLLKRILDFLVPPRCFCKDIVEDDGLLCENCWKRVHFIRSFCTRCGATLDIDDLQICEACFHNKNRIPGRSAVIYDDLARDIVLQFKHSDACRLGFIMAAYMLACDKAFFSDIDALIPVPIHFFRLLKRKYNQSAILAIHVAKSLQKPVLHNVLYKKKHTAQQGHMSKEERIHNVKDSFLARHAELIKDKTILLVDDVITTGATINECAKVLRRAGAKQVKFITFARAT